MDDHNVDLTVIGDDILRIREQLGDAEIHLAATDIEVDVADAFKLPLGQMAALGVGLGSLPAMFRSVTTTINWGCSRPVFR